MIEVMNKTNNYFYKFKETGGYEIIDDSIKVKGNYKVGQYIRIVGSFLNDGIYKVITVSEDRIVLQSTLKEQGTEFNKALENEGFKGCVCSLAVPNEFLNLCKKIEEFKANYKESDKISESFANYSYSKATNADGMIITWQDKFKNDLKEYRKMNDDLRRVKEWH